jgi:hypothetical protein
MLLLLVIMTRTLTLCVTVTLCAGPFLLKNQAGSIPDGDVLILKSWVRVPYLALNLIVLCPKFLANSQEQ